MKLRDVILVTHRWLGLASSVVIALVGVTGAMLVWPSQSIVSRTAGSVHEELALGWRGWWIVVAATVVTVVLELGGVMLWWRRKILRVRLRSGWTRALSDLHHAGGVLALPLMFLLAATGVGMALVNPYDNPPLRRIIFDLHTTRGFSIPIKVLYTVGSMGFLLQGVTGVVMWWKGRRPASMRNRSQETNQRM